MSTFQQISILIAGNGLVGEVVPNGPQGKVWPFPVSADTNLDLPIVLIRMNPDPMDQPSRVNARFDSLAEAMLFAVASAAGNSTNGQILAVLDRDDRLVLAGQVTDGAVAWCNSVESDA